MFISVNFFPIVSFKLEMRTAQVTLAEKLEMKNIEIEYILNQTKHLLYSCKYGVLPSFHVRSLEDTLTVPLRQPTGF